MKKLLLILVILTLATPAPAAQLFALVKMQGGSPVLPEGVKFHGYVLHAQKGDLGLYQFSGTAAEMDALKVAPGITPIGTADKLTTALADADVTKINAEATKVVFPSIVTKSTVETAVKTLAKAVAPAYQMNGFGVSDPEQITKESTITEVTK